MNDRLNNQFSYSVAIRTLGTAGKKYENLLKSIERQTVKPEKIIVVLPEGYAEPSPITGDEIFIHSPKGMIIQRLFAIDYIDSDFILFCDDDIELEEEFVEKLIDPLLNSDYSCSSGPLLSFFPPKTIKYCFASLLGGACRMVHGKDRYYTKILATGGWSYNHCIDLNNHKYYEAESLAWTCFFIRSDAMKAIRFEDEMWFEKYGYSAFEDRGMFYKLLLNGYKTCVVSDAEYIHNDGKTSTRELKLEPIFARAFNHYVFWHRYLYLTTNSSFKKLWLKVCINYYIRANSFYSFIQFVLKRITKDEFKAGCEGFKEAKIFVKSEEYINLNPVMVRNDEE